MSPSPLRTVKGCAHCEDYRLIVGDALACEDAEPMPCDVDTLSGTFEQATMRSPSLREVNAHLLPGDPRCGLALRRGGTSPRRRRLPKPLRSRRGHDLASFLYQNDRALMRFGDEEQTVQVAIGESGWPSILDYDRMPVFVSIQAYEPGNWVFRSRCY